MAYVFPVPGREGEVKEESTSFPLTNIENKGKRSQDPEGQKLKTDLFARVAGISKVTRSKFQK